MIYRYTWRKGRKPELYSRTCRIVATGSMGSCVVEWTDGGRDCVSRRALRRVD